MKALVLRQYNRRLALEDVDDPIPEAGDVVVRVGACGMCYTDVKIFRGELSGAIGLPHVPGHEVAGQVVDVGPGVSNKLLGARGICAFLLGCRDCEMCRTGRENLCFSLRRLGFELPGGYAEYVTLPAYNFCPSVGDTPYEEWAVIPDAIATPYHALNVLTRPRFGERILIVGCGGLGLHAVQIARRMGLEVLAVDQREHAIEAAQRYGATAALKAGTGDPVEFVMAHTHGLGVDYLLEGVGNAETLTFGLRCLKKGGTCVIMGYDPVNPVPVRLIDVHNNEWRILGTKAATKQDMQQVLRLVDTGAIEAVVSRTIGMNDVNEALDRIAAGGVLGRTVIVPGAAA